MRREGQCFLLSSNEAQRNAAWCPDIFSFLFFFLFFLLFSFFFVFFVFSFLFLFCLHIRPHGSHIPDETH
ncbi:hypothetical protein EYF80_063224 [Liparis tanakae]|uniref:Uncharacterized protein n=1 Tax=Liparis tanakae TaxID=230148 RepID=A0A4Z2EDK3_9TELE|nr:hypothetical protein EYF80_063224 [Liparis tanakae]